MCTIMYIHNYIMIHFKKYDNVKISQQEHGILVYLEIKYLLRYQVPLRVCILEVFSLWILPLTDILSNQQLHNCTDAFLIYKTKAFTDAFLL